MELPFEKPKLTEKQRNVLIACPICKKEPTVVLNRHMTLPFGHKHEYYQCVCNQCGLIGRGGMRIADAIKKWNGTVHKIIDAIGKRDLIEVALNVEDSFEPGAVGNLGKLAYFPQVPNKGDPVIVGEDSYIIDEIGWTVLDDGTVFRPTLWLIPD